MSTTTVAEYELAIPGKFVSLFRLSLVDELNADADWIKSHAPGVLEVYAAGDPSVELRHGSPSELADAQEAAQWLDARLADFASPIRSLADDYVLFDQIARSDPRPGQDLAVRGSFEALHGALEATIRRAARDLVAECDFAPIDGGRVVNRSWAATWAAEQIERLETAVAA